jgi:site-specific recombinase XerD
VGQRNEAAWLRGAVDAAALELPRRGLAAETARSTLLTWDRFVAFAAARGLGYSIAELTEELTSGFVNARNAAGCSPSGSTVKWRRSALRLLFRIWRDLGIHVADPTMDLAVPRGAARRYRPLSDDEVELCRWATFESGGATRRPVAWALAEAGACSGQIPGVRAGDVDLDASTVRLRGDAKTDSRTVPLTDWGRLQLARRITARGSISGSLVYDGTAGLPAARSSASNALSHVLRRAGLGNDLGVGPRSITAWVGRCVFDETGDIAAVARRLGMRSLDGAAALIGWDWHDR